MAEHSPALGHHWENLEQQHEANVLGMWVFLVTELMLFGGMFLAYIVFSSLYPDVFAEASHHQNVAIGAINTAVLITSSVCMVLAVRSTQLSARRAAMIFFALTALLGLIFIGLKGVEYYQHWQEQLVPGLNFHFEGQAGERAALFFFLYFAMTGIHAIHMLIGIGIVLVVLLMVWRGRLLGAHYTSVEVVGLYWHFVDVVWVFLFPLLYLIGRHGP